MRIAPKYLIQLSLFSAAIVMLLCVRVTYADEKLKGIACRSVHLGYTSGEVTAFTTEMIVRESAPGSYFMACGWDKGYFGIQEQGKGQKVVIFSVWDSYQNDRNKVDEELRVKVLHKDEAVRVGRFGGEGTGGQSFFNYEWQLDTPYRFLVTARKGDLQGKHKRTEYSGYFYLPEAKSWKHLVTFSTVTGGRESMRGLYSFVEDFKRDQVSTTKTRRAEFGPGWVRDLNGTWHAAKEARFTADANPVLNIDAGLVSNTNRMFLATGGEIQMTGPKLREKIILPDDRLQQQPNDLPELTW